MKMAKLAIFDEILTINGKHQLVPYNAIYRSQPIIKPLPKGKITPPRIGR